MSGKMQNLPVRVLTALVYGTIVIGSLLIHPVLFAVVLFVFAILAGYEFFKLTLTDKPILPMLYHIIAALFLFSTHVSIFFRADAFIFGIFGVLLRWFLILALFLFTALILFGVIDIILRKQHDIHYLYTTFFALFYITLPLWLISVAPYFLHNKAVLGFNKSAVILLFAVIWTYDTMAYFIGSLWGKRRLAPTISPAKTWEGALGGGLLTLLIFLIVRIFFFKDFQMITYILSVIIIMIFATFGDLFESRIKRRVGVKDSGTIFPGHGGALDRIDSVLFAAPIYFSLLILLKVLN